MKVFIKGKGEISLSDNDFIAEGGQGKVYGKSGVAYKIYIDPANMISLPKFDELSRISSDRVIRPLDVILNPKTNKAIGFTMKHLDNGQTTPLAQLFTKGFRNRSGITPDDMLGLVKDMQSTYSNIHKAGCLVIDGNELSFKVDNGVKEVYFLDVDSFQTPNYPATFQMESIKDRHTHGFNENTDWFAWGIVTFQALIGIHPFKGFHKVHKDDFMKRMDLNLSVFSTDVDLPPVVQPFSVIPSTLLQWYKAVFQDGKRLPPPTDYVGVVIITTDVRHISGTDKFEITLMEKLGSDIVEFLSVGGTRVKLTTATTKSFTRGVYVGIGPKMGRIVFAYIDNGAVSISTDRGQSLPVTLNAEQMMSYAGRIYYKNGTNVYQIELHETPQHTLATARAVGNVHEKATRLFEGMAIQNLFGSAHVSLFPEPNVCRTIAVKEIKGTVVDAKFDNRIAMVVTADTQGKYHRHVLRFAKDYGSYEVMQTVDDITYTGLNFVVLDKGICCHINEKSEVELFTNSIGNTLMKVVSDPMIKSDIRLAKDGDQVLFFKGTELYTLKLK